MGVLNRTPDSFSDGGKFMDEDAALRHVRKMVSDGADIIDIGGESTRPGSRNVSLSEEINRTIPIIEKISRELEVPISIDTSKHEVALEAIRAGAAIVNDITGLKSDAKMAGVISKSGASVCVMHIKGTPEYMQDNPIYDDLMAEIIDSLRESIGIAVEAGISPDKIIVDPGIGFGKTTRHNLTIINRLSELKVLDKPILIGTSRKSFIGETLEREPAERLMGTAVTSALAIMNGANIIRVHDVKEMADVARMADAVKRTGI
ncbi:MAG: dihydropteroate synthase [Candidatus Omnitrophota bacterium]|nr:MAG: dihydropteroate synthase [Candidatus Omnitrophota bacterium]